MGEVIELSSASSSIGAVSGVFCVAALGLFALFQTGPSDDDDSMQAKATANAKAGYAVGQFESAPPPKLHPPQVLEVSLSPSSDDENSSMQAKAKANTKAGYAVGQHRQQPPPPPPHQSASRAGVVCSDGACRLSPKEMGERYIFFIFGGVDFDRMRRSERRA